MAQPQYAMPSVQLDPEVFPHSIPFEIDRFGRPDFTPWQPTPFTDARLRLYTIVIPQEVRDNRNTWILTNVPTKQASYGMTMSETVASLCADGGWPVASMLIIEEAGTRVDAIEKSGMAAALIQSWNENYRELLGWTRHTLDNGQTIELTRNLRFAMSAIDDHRVFTSGRAGNFVFLGRIKQINVDAKNNFVGWQGTQQSEKTLLMMMYQQTRSNDEWDRFAHRVRNDELGHPFLEPAYEIAKTGSTTGSFEPFFEWLRERHWIATVNIGLCSSYTPDQVRSMLSRLLLIKEGGYKAPTLEPASKAPGPNDKLRPEFHVGWGSGWMNLL